MNQDLFRLRVRYIGFSFRFFKRWIYGFGLRFLGVEYTGSAFGSWALDTGFDFRLGSLDIWISAFSS
ncbi:unnamed protein product [Rhizophagus irregularis]|nr:unnamed protein product [Rhizophagus irregularis]